MIRPKVLFLCSGNSCRTQMAEAFLRDIAGDRFEALSAGAAVSQLDISGHQPKDVARFLPERVAYLITLCDREIERTCPIFSGATWRLTWPIVNPASVQRGEEHRVHVLRARDEIRAHVAQFVQEHT